MPLFRPPSEGDNLIVQATIGCSWNHCSFCSMYRSKQYRPRPQAELFAHIDDLVAEWPTAHRVFLADGDALTLPTEDLLAIAAKLRDSLPNLTRISAYATPLNILKKSPEDLAALKEAKLNLLYLGVESGSAEVLRRIAKGVTPERLAEAINKARSAGLKISATVILGIAGQDGSDEHADATAALINKAAPHYLSTLQLTLMPDAAPDFLARWDGKFRPLDDEGVLAEQKRLLEKLNPAHPVIFRSNHASNCLALAGTLPKDKDRLLADVAMAQTGQGHLRPQWLRGL